MQNSAGMVYSKKVKKNAEKYYIQYIFNSKNQNLDFEAKF